MALSTANVSELCIYTPTLKDRDIRLLDVEVNSSGSDEVIDINSVVRCGFRIVSLDDTPLPSYTAISYCWGNSRPVCRIELTSGGDLPLSRTLVDLLKALAGRAAGSVSKFTIWVDALCINQGDAVEKASQVAQLGNVYERAEEVLVWLGHGSPTSKRAFQYMHSKQEVAEEGNTDSEDDLDGLLDVFRILRRPWFQRVWVIQEATLNSNVFISCGEDRISFNVFEHCIDRVWKFLDYPDWTNAAASLLSVSRLFALRDTYQRAGRVSYETLLEAAFHCRATDLRDKVYAFRGIADNSRPVPKPDYTISETDLFVQAARALLCHGTCLDLLALCGIAASYDNESGEAQQKQDEKESEEKRTFPTWAPDLSLISWDEPFVVADRAGWNAGGEFLKSPSAALEDDKFRYLHLTTRLVDVVTHVCPPFDSNSVAGQQEAFDSIGSLKPAQTDVEDWLQSLVSTLVFGLNIDDEPDLEGYQEHFAEWYKWLKESTTDEDLEKMAENKFHLTLKTRVNTWRAFMTRNGFVGVGPPVIAQNDILFTVPGCRIPLLMRPEESSSYETDVLSVPKQASELVGWCFVEGLMFGEAQKLDRNLVEVVLC